MTGRRGTGMPPALVSWYGSLRPISSSKFPGLRAQMLWGSPGRSRYCPVYGSAEQSIAGVPLMGLYRRTVLSESSNSFPSGCDFRSRSDPKTVARSFNPRYGDRSDGFRLVASAAGSSSIAKRIQFQRERAKARGLMVFKSDEINSGGQLLCLCELK
jgi:hypothetical protein